MEGNKMKFKDFKYEHLELETIKEEFGALLKELEACDNAETFMQAFKKTNKYRSHIQTMLTLCNIRHSIDTSDEYYDKERNYLDETVPYIQAYETKFFKLVNDCPFKNELDIPETFFKLCEYSLKTFDEKNHR